MSDLEKKVSFVVKFATALHKYGATAQSLEGALANVMKTLGLDGQFFATPTLVLASFHTDDGEKHSVTRLKPGVVDLEKISELDLLGDMVIEKQISIDDALISLDNITQKSNRYPKSLELLAYGLISAAVSVFFSASIEEILISLFLGLIIGFFAVTIGYKQRTSTFLEFFAGFFATFTAAFIYKFFFQFSVEIVTIASLIVFIPGLTLTISMTELATENLASGTARFFQAILIFLKLAFGVFLGTKIATAMFGKIILEDFRLSSVPDFYEVPALVVAVVSLMILFRAKPRDLKWMMLAGFISFYSAKFGSQLLGLDFGAFLGSFLVGLTSNLFARFRKRPAAIMFMPGLLLLVPGSIGFKGLAFLAEKQTIAGIDATFQMFIIATALVAGLLLANIIVVSKRNL